MRYGRNTDIPYTLAETKRRRRKASSDVWDISTGFDTIRNCGASMRGDCPVLFCPEYASARGRVPGGNFIAGGRFSSLSQELCKNAVEEVILPDTVEEIGGCAFYDCRKLKRLHMGAAVRTIGSDAFMNAFSLQTIVLRALAGEKSGIQRA